MTHAQRRCIIEARARIADVAGMLATYQDDPSLEIITSNAVRNLDRVNRILQDSIADEEDGQ